MVSFAVVGFVLAQIDPRWSAQRAPFPGPPRAIGAYSAGCVQGAVRLPPDGRGYRVMYLGRGRSFGHPTLVGYVRRLAAAADRRRLGPLLVADLAQPRGGPTPFGHRSHQSGLDVDIWYSAPPRAARGLSAADRERLQAPAVVDLKAQALTPAWRPQIVDLLALAAADESVDRIFVHAAVKREVCARVPTATPWLRKLRPWWGHHDHFHVRLRCPPGSPDCQGQEPLGDDPGCGALAWWFGDEARAARERRQAEAAPPALPEACLRLLGPATGDHGLRPPSR